MRREPGAYDSCRDASMIPAGMRSRWAHIASILLVAGAAPGALRTQPEDAQETQPAIAALQAAYSVPPGIAELLPPGVRPAVGSSDWMPAAEVPAGRGAEAGGPLVER